MELDKKLFGDVPQHEWHAIQHDLGKLHADFQSKFDAIQAKLKVARLRAAMIEAGRDPDSPTERKKLLRDLFREFEIE